MNKGLKFASPEELHLAHDRLQAWLYRPPPFGVEPAYQNTYSEQQLMQQREGWLKELNYFMYRHQAPSPHHPNGGPVMQSPATPRDAVARSPVTQASKPPPVRGREPPVNAANNRARTQPSPSHLSESAANDIQKPSHVVESVGRSSSINGSVGHGQRAEPKLTENSEKQARPHVGPANSPNEQSTSRRRSRQERHWCPVCKSDPYWCIHSQNYEGMHPRSRPTGSYYTGFDENVTSEAIDPTPIPSQQAGKKRKRPGPHKKSSRVSFTRENGYRDSGVVLSSEEDEDDDEDGRHTYTHDKQRRSLAKESDPDFRKMLDSVPKTVLSKMLIKLCEGNSLVMRWVKEEMQHDHARTSSSTTVESMDAAARPHKQLVPESRAIVQSPERQATPVVCTRCEASYDPTGERKEKECRYHDGTLYDAK